MANLATVDSDLHASHLRLDAFHTSMLFKLDLLSRKLDTMIFRQRFLFPSSVLPPSPPLLSPPLFPSSAQPPPLPSPPAPPSNASSYHPSQYPPPPRSHVPPPMAGQRDSPVIGIDSSTIDFPVSVWQHHRVTINHHFQSNQVLPLPLRTDHRRYYKIPYNNDIILHGDPVVAHQIHQRWIWVFFTFETQR